MKLSLILITILLLSSCKPVPRPLPKFAVASSVKLKGFTTKYLVTYVLCSNTRTQCRYYLITDKQTELFGINEELLEEYE